MFRILVLLNFLWLTGIPIVHADFVQTAYTPQKVVYEFYFSDPHEINSALFWLRSHVNTLYAAPYDISIDENNIKVIIHGTEVVSLVKKNYEKYKEAVERMRYYADLGVEFKVCALAAKDFDYHVDDFHDFIDIVPSAMTELAHWQLQGYALIRPLILKKEYRTEEIR